MFFLQYLGVRGVRILYKIYLWSDSDDSSDTVQPWIGFCMPVLHIVKSKILCLTIIINVGAFLLVWSSRPCAMKYSYILSPLKPGLHLNANGTRMRHVNEKPSVNVDVLPRWDKQHLAVRRTFTKQPNTICRLLVHQGKFTYNTFMYGRFAASANAEQCTNVPYILPRLLSPCVVRIQCKPIFRLTPMLTHTVWCALVSLPTMSSNFFSEQYCTSSLNSIGDGTSSESDGKYAVHTAHPSGRCLPHI